MTDSEEQIRNEEVSDFVERRYSTTLMGIVRTVEWVLIALILAFVFRAFMMEQFRIPTGSMAETLRGVHYHLRCGRCGYKYDTDVDAASSRCPSCKYLFDPETIVSISNGDRIFVDKCLYNFTEPKRWDVVVFKNPLNPKENYIKRMIALPGEKVEIVDGDIYIDGQIARKPAKVQQEFWMPILVNDFQPAGRTMKNDGDSDDGLKNSTWTQPFSNQGASKWDMTTSGTVFRLNTTTDEMNTIVYDNPGMYSDDVFLSMAGFAEAYYCDLDMSCGATGTNCFYEDPQFVDPDNLDFNLLATSACIDTGIDFFVLSGDTLVNMTPDQYFGSAPDVGAFEYDDGSGMEDEGGLPQSGLVLNQNSPNPFSSTTVISFELDQNSHVSLIVYDLSGREVRTLADSERTSGLNSVVWNGSNNSGESVPTGTYIIRLQTDSCRDSVKAVLIN